MSETPSDPEISIEIIDFSMRTLNVLRHNGVRTLKQLCELASTDVLLFRNMGKRSLYELRQKLAEYGLSLRDETVDLDIKKVIIHALPIALRKIGLQVDKIQSELHWFRDKIDQLISRTEKKQKDL